MSEMEYKEWLKRVSQKSGSKIEGSGCFLSIFTENFKDNPQCALELGIAIMLDKPIALIVPNGTKVPRVLQKIAGRIEYFDESSTESFNTAMTSLGKYIKELQ